MADAYDSPQARACPAFVRASPIAWEIVKSSTGEVIGETTGLREALERAAKLLTDKPLVLHGESGEPDGVWRYLPAASAEDAPNEQDGVRLTEKNIWQLAAGLNARPQAIPVDGGPGSEVHGTAHDSATPANGWAHHGIVVYDSAKRASLYLRAEMISTVATMVDRGQLAFGSIHFFTSEPLDESGAPAEAGLISYGLTNTPADQRITPASAVRAHPNHARVASRTRQLLRAAPLATERSMASISKKDILAALDEIKGNDVDMDQLATVIAGKVAAAGKPKEEPPAAAATKEEKPAAEAPPPARATSGRGAAFDLITAIAPKLGLTAEDALGDESGYCNKLGERLWKVIDAAKLEQILETVAAGGTPPARSQTPGAPPEKRAIPGLEDAAALEAFAAACVDEMRAILGKPDATPAELLSELQAARDKLAAAMSAAPPPASDGTPADQQGANTPEARALAEEVTRCRSAFSLPTADAPTLLAHARIKSERAENRLWLDQAILDRKLAVPEAERAEMLDEVASMGREKFTKTVLARMARPPAKMPMTGDLLPPARAAEPEDYSEAVDACMEQARSECPKDSPKHFIRARAQKIARKVFPHLAEPEAPAAS